MGRVTAPIMKPLTMTELKQIEAREFFADMKTISQLQSLSSPRLNYMTIMNAINRQKLVCQKFGGDIDAHGVWLISLQSAKIVWPDRFNGEK